MKYSLKLKLLIIIILVFAMEYISPAFLIAGLLCHVKSDVNPITGNHIIVAKSSYKDEKTETSKVSHSKQEPEVCRTIHFGALNNDTDRVSYQFIRTLSSKLSENIECLLLFGGESNLNLSMSSHLSDENRYIIYKGENIDINTIKRELAKKAFCSSLAHTFEKTRLGKKTKEIEEKISKYFFIEFSKDYEGKTDFHLPGQAEPSVLKEEKAYKVSLSSSFCTDIDSLHGSYTLNSDASYYNYRMNSEYNFGNGKMVLSLGNKYLNSLFGATIGISIVKNRGEPASGIINISWIIN